MLTLCYSVFTFAFLHLSQVFEGWLQAEVHLMAVAQMQEKVPRTERRASVVDQLPG